MVNKQNAHQGRSRTKQPKTTRLSVDSELTLDRLVVLLGILLRVLEQWVGISQKSSQLVSNMLN